jgi:hypothetical protein
MTERQARHVVHPVNLLDSETVHHAVLDHRQAARAALLRRLEDEDCIARESTRFGKVAGGSEQHGRVPVMAAGVHLAGHRRCPQLSAFLVDRQRIHVRAQSNGSLGSFAAALQHGNHPGAANPLHNLVAAESPQLGGDVSRRAMHIVKQLRIPVVLTPPSDNLVVKVSKAVDDGHGILRSDRPRLFGGGVSRQHAPSPG